MTARIRSQFSPMPMLLVESYGANHEDALRDARGRALLAAEIGADVRYVRKTILPEDETLLRVFEAPSAEALRRAGQLAALPVERIVEAVEAFEAAEAIECCDVRDPTLKQQLL